MSGDDVKRNQTQQVQQELPAGAGTAGPVRSGGGAGEVGTRGVGAGEVGAEEGIEDAARESVRWVGLQHVMDGFCGRAPEQNEAPLGGGEAAPQVPKARVAAGGLGLRRRQVASTRVAPKRVPPPEGGPGPESRAA